MKSPDKSNEIKVAILPFEQLGSSEALQDFLYGFHEDLIISFSKFIGISVIAPHSSRQLGIHSGSGKLKELAIDYHVTGSFRKQQEKVRINLHLVRTKDDQVVFAGQYQEELEDLLEVQDRIITQIVNVLQKQIDYDLLSYSYRKSSVQLRAYENYLLGMSELRKGSLEHDLKARSFFEAALKIEPTYARALTGISLSYFNEWSCQLWDRWDVSQKGAHEYAVKALEKDEKDYMANNVVARTYLYSEEFETAEHFVRKSLRMNPNDSDNLIRGAFTLMFLGYPEESVALYHKARTLNPYHEDIYFAYGANFYFEAGDYQQAIDLGAKVNQQSSWVDFPFYLAAAHHYLGNEQQMQEQWQNYLTLFKGLIYTGNAALEKEAIDWQQKVNPFKKGSRADAFRDYLSEKLALSLAQPKTEQTTASSAATFIQREEVWELNFQGVGIYMKDAKGYHDLAKLISQPNQEFHCTDLMGTTLDANSGGESIDNKAKKDYKKRILELQTEIQEAEMMNNIGALPDLRTEYDQILQHLSQSLELNGKARQIGTTTEKARSAITWRIRSTIKKIAKEHPTLGKHLSQSIKTGTFCSYQPELEIVWEV